MLHQGQQASNSPANLSSISENSILISQYNNNNGVLHIYCTFEYRHIYISVLSLIFSPTLRYRSLKIIQAHSLILIFFCQAFRNFYPRGMNILEIIDGQTKSYMPSMNNDTITAQAGPSSGADDERRSSLQDVALPLASARSFACPFEDCAKVSIIAPPISPVNRPYCEILMYNMIYVLTPHLFRVSIENRICNATIVFTLMNALTPALTQVVVKASFKEVL